MGGVRLVGLLNSSSTGLFAVVLLGGDGSWKGILMRSYAPRVLMATGVVLLGAKEAQAGMPTPVLSEWAAMRLEALSFFLVAVLVSTALVRWLWNLLAKDFPRLPRLGYGKALAAVVLWGLMLIVVLTMIAGARELMTPGAWQKQGLLYKVAANDAPRPDSPRLRERKEQLEWLRTALWNYAATHHGKLPEKETTLNEPQLWEVPGGAGIRYVYAAGRTVGDSSDVVACEPEVFDDGRLTLQANGEITVMSTSDLRQRLQKEARP